MQPYHLRLHHYHKVIQQLADNTYEYHPLRYLRKRKKGGGYRTIGVPTVLDNMAMSLMNNDIQALINHMLPGHVHGFVNGRGTHTAYKAVENAIDNMTMGYVDMWQVTTIDIINAFDNVNRDVLMEKATSYLTPALVKNLYTLLHERTHISTVKYSGARSRDTMLGINQGWAVSPALFNLYLLDFYNGMEQNGCRVISYADNFFVIGPSSIVDANVEYMAFVLKYGYGMEVNVQTYEGGTNLTWLGRNYLLQRAQD